MSDLTDEDIARCEQTSEFCDEEFWALLAEVKRHRAAMVRLEEYADRLDRIGGAAVECRASIAAEIRACVEERVR